MMQLTILGCSGGIGSDNRTTSLLVDNDILIDCGTGLGELPLDALRDIRHVFLTHSHLDHIAYLPLLVDSAFENFRETPLQVYALGETIDSLKTHIFNWRIWPDFSSLPDPAAPSLKFVEIQQGDLIRVGRRQVRAIPVNHSIPATGYYVAVEDGGAFAFTGDTAANPDFWDALNSESRLDLLLTECAYPDSRREIARLAHHYNSSALTADIERLAHRPDLRISHLTPGLDAEIMAELEVMMAHWQPKALQRGDTFTL